MYSVLQERFFSVELNVFCLTSKILKFLNIIILSYKQDSLVWNRIILSYKEESLVWN